MIFNGHIYKITNKVNGKMYIGKTELYNAYERWNEHISESVKERSYDRYLYKAMRKYGTENFEFKIIESIYDGNLPEMEEKYIELYRTYGNGYNMTKGGDGAYYIDREKVVDNYLENFNCKITANVLNIHEETVRKIIKGCDLLKYQIHSNATPVELKDIKSGEIFVFKSSVDTGHYIVVNYTERYKACENRYKKACDIAFKICSVCKGKHENTYGFTCRQLNIKEYSEIVFEQIEQKDKGKIITDIRDDIKYSWNN